MRADLKALGDTVIESVKGYVSKAVEELSLRLDGFVDSFDSRLKAIPAGERGEKGDAGKDAEPIDVARVIAEVAAQIPKPERGEKGCRGDDGKVDPELVRLVAAETLPGMVERAREMLSEQLAAKLPDLKGERGEKGDAGKDADPAHTEEFISTQIREVFEAIPKPKDGEPGRDGVSEDQVSAMVLRMVASAVSEAVTPAVAKAFDAIRPPNDGVDGKDGPPGRDGRDGLPGVPGLPGEKGVDGINGKDGHDGLDLKNFSAVLNDDGRTVVMKLADESNAVEVPLVFPVPLERGVFNADGTTYSKGDGVTYDGSFWFAQKDAPIGKPGISSDWRLATKRGRDGKDGIRGEKGDRGTEGRAGRDLTQLGFDGRKSP